ncbi:WhiB family transcriptional regulator [Actinosynnema pretiosum subsp. pretiosum]|uniref:Transcriptional regulator WhiB n=1 Tax=Actinosynnema pretiosum subsp. pretiosum TaxID=103721 RepID=A0AA45LEG7_9PSEU|nr:WhiB family transcriptional regulator [Actinosynnema pretiosum subsp. pretiosum]
MSGTDFGAHPACVGEDPELFFPLPAQHDQVAAAKAVCGWCPVRQACLTNALHHGVEGVWGGTTEEERRQLRLAVVDRKAAA